MAGLTAIEGILKSKGWCRSWAVMHRLGDAWRKRCREAREWGVGGGREALSICERMGRPGTGFRHAGAIHPPHSHECAYAT